MEEHYIRPMDLAVKPLPEKAIKAFAGIRYSVWQWEQELYDGSTTTFERVERADAAHVIAVLEDERIMLVKDTQPDRGAVLTPAGGLVEEGEDPWKAAARELTEETGYATDDVVSLHTYRPSGRIEVLVHAFVGRNCTKVSDTALEAGEKIELVFFSFDEFLDQGHNPNMRDLMLRTRLLEAKYVPEKKEEMRKLLYG